MYKTIIAAAALMTLVSCSTMQGVVRDKQTGAPVPSALVKIGSHSGATDAFGSYKVRGSFIPGDTMLVNAPGYHIHTRTVTSANGVVDVELTKFE